MIKEPKNIRGTTDADAAVLPGTDPSLQLPSRAPGTRGDSAPERRRRSVFNGSGDGVWK